MAGQSQSSSLGKDPEKNAGDYAHLTNASIRSFGWEAVTVTVKDRPTKKPKAILQGINGVVKAGEMLAIMGPSGSGKTTLLNVLAHRDAASSATVESSMFLNGKKTLLKDFRRISAYVEQDDALVGSLTVRETMYFAAQLSLPSSVSKTERMERIEALIAAFGLQDQSDLLIGTPIRKGISGGQKRRVSVASQLITSPKILFLDEPTSGLDSQAAFEVMNFVKNIATSYKIIVIASIHQPSTSTFSLFNKLLLLAAGETVYNGSITGVRDYFSSIGYEMPQYMNPAEYILELINTDFSRNRERAFQQLREIQSSWSKSAECSVLVEELEHETLSQSTDNIADDHNSASSISMLLTLIHRSYIKSYRDILAYGIRIAMYLGLGILMGTVWLRLSTNQSNIEAFTNSIFYGGAFMSFMAVASIPAYLEDRALYVKERQNGLYGPSVFMLSNFIVGLMPLFIITILFSVVVYWLSNFRPSAEGFWTWVLWLFLDLVAAESLVVLVTNLCPIFVVSLAATAFANGLWMSVNGFMVQPHTLNPFWRYVFHYIDYQAYVFQGMMVNEFAKRTYQCATLPGGGCQCMYSSPLEGQCEIAGTAVLDSYGYKTGKTGLWVGILIGIIAGYRVLGWLVLYLRKH